MTRTFATVVLALVLNCCYAQKFTDSLFSTTTFARFNPLGLVDVRDLNISFGVEKRISHKSSVALDGSFIFFSQMFGEKSHYSRGFMFRPAYRFFPAQGKVFIEIEGHYKQVTQKLTDWVGRDVVNDVPTYDEYATFRLRKSVKGAHLKVGRQYYLSKHFWLEVYVGIGVHYRKYKVVDDPRMRYALDNVFLMVTSVDQEVVPALPAGLRLLYRLSK